DPVDVVVITGVVDVVDVVVVLVIDGIVTLKVTLWIKPTNINSVTLWIKPTNINSGTILHASYLPGDSGNCYDLLVLNPNTTLNASASTAIDVITTNPLVGDTSVHIAFFYSCYNSIQLCITGMLTVQWGIRVSYCQLGGTYQAYLKIGNASPAGLLTCLFHPLSLTTSGHIKQMLCKAFRDNLPLSRTRLWFNSGELLQKLLATLNA
ncbi:unnamed protein product, partial [Didymodactylos carnosus]